MPGVPPMTWPKGRPHDAGRRNFLRAGAGVVAGAPLAACSSQDPYSLEKPSVPGAERWNLHEEKTIATACAQCPAGCGISARVVEGRVVSVRGQPGNPVHPGGIGPRGLASPYVLYDPDRIRGPMRRQGGALAEVSWDEALSGLATRLGALRSRGRPDRLAIVCGRERGMIRDLWERFARSFGTPTFLDVSLRKDGATASALYAMQGVRETPAYDWPRARYVLSLGAPLLEESCQSVHQARSTVHYRTHRGAERGTIVQVEPSYSRTAANADEWVRIAPGSYGALAMGLAHVLVRDRLYDRDFIAGRAFGFENWTDDQGRTHRGFRDLLVRDYSPERVAECCRIPTETVERLAAELAANGPSFVVSRGVGTRERGALHTAMAVHALNALLGAIDRPGGLLVQSDPPTADWPSLELDDLAQASLQRPGIATSSRPLGSRGIDDLADALLAQPAGSIDTLFLYYSNPCYSGMDPARWRRALARVPFVVSFSPFLDETTAEIADLVLPDHSYLERWEDAASAPSVGFPVQGVRQPLVEPLHDTRPSADVVLELARQMGGKVAEAFPWPDFRAALFERLSGIHEAQRGSIIEGSVPHFLRALFRRGFWEDPGSPRQESIRTPSGRFEFFSLRLWQGFGESWLRESGVGIDRELACLPHFADPAKHSSPDFPLLLEPYQPGSYAEGSGANLPVLQELVTEPGDRAWQTTAFLHPDTADQAHVAAGDRVRIESPLGSIELPVAVRAGVHPDVVRIAKGGGHTAWGRFALGRGANVMELIPHELDPFVGTPVLQGVNVRIRRA